MGERVFVTGAGGQIGRELVARLVAQGDEVVGLVRRDTEALRALGAEPLLGDLLDPVVLEQGIAGADRVYHLAGGVRGPGTESADRINRLGTLALTEVAVRHKRSLRSVVFSSTCAIYGDRAGHEVGEDQAPSPDTRYGHSKVAAEAILLRAAREQGLAVRVARIGAVYGPTTRFLQAERLRAGRGVLPGTGKNQVPVVHIDDVVSALVALAERGDNARIYNVAGGTEPTLRAFYAEVQRHAGGSPMRFLPVPGPAARLAAWACEAALSRLGARPRFTPDNLRLYTASVRMRTDRLAQEIGFRWVYADHVPGIAACFSP